MHILKNKHFMQEYYSKTVCFNPVQWIFLFGLVVIQSTALRGQCTDPSISLPDENQPVSNPSVSYCVSIPINPAVTGDPIGFSLELDHTYIGDLSIRVSACGETLMLMTRPGGGACNAGAPFGSSATVGGFYTFSEGGGPDPDPNLATNGGDYGLSGDPCGINTVNTFAELAAACGGGTYNIEFCITDHAFVNTGFAGNIAPIFPGVPPTICGCTDPLALNYNPAASFDDGTCEYPPGCGENFYDSGGPTGDYPSNANETVTICADVPGDVVTVSFSFFDIESGFDNLAIFDGPNASSPLIGNYDGTNSPGTVTSSHSSGCLTFVFDSDGSVQDPGWVATVFCDPPCVPPPPPSVTAPTICEGESAAITAAGCPSGIVQWFNSPSSTIPIAVGPVYNTPALNTSATYYVACDDNGCASDRVPVTVQVTAPQTPALTPIGPLCQGDAPVALSNIQGGITGTWSGQGVGGGVFNPQLVSPGSSAPITFTPDPGQCALPADLFVEVLVQPVPQITGPSVICTGNTEFLNVVGTYATYVWSTGDVGETLPIASSGTYTVTVTSLAGGCPGEASFTVNASPPPDPVISGDLDICTGETTTLTVPNTFASYSWSNGGSGPATTVTQPGPVSITVTDASGCEGTATVQVDETFIAPPAISAPQTLCAGTGGSVAITNASSYDTFSWSTGGGGSVAAIPGPGTYTVTVTQGGCETTGTVTVAENFAIPPTINGELAICQGETTALSVSPSYASYSWSTGGDGQTETVGTDGFVGVTVTDNQGCVAETSTFVDVAPPPNVQLTGDEVACDGAFAVIAVQDPGSYAAFNWSNSETGSTISVSAGGDYTVTATDNNGCEGTATFTVTQAPLPSAEITGANSFCTGGSTELSAVADGLTYAWSTGDNTQTTTVTEPGAVFLTVTNAEGCQSVNTITVTETDELAPQIEGPTAFCAGDAITLTTNGDFNTYQWSDGSGGPTVTVTGPGTVSVTVTDENGCDGNTSVVVTENALPDVAINGDLAFCEGTGTALTAPAGMAAYTWSDDSTDPLLGVTEAGTYGLTITDSNGCSNTAQATVVENPLPEPEITGLLAFCSDTATVLGLTQAYDTYTWSDGSTGPELTVGATQDISVTVTNAAGCEAADSVAITAYPLPEVSILGPEQFCEGESVALAADQNFPSYQWSNNSTDSILTVNTSGEYSLTVTDENGCTGTAAFTVEQTLLPEASITGDTVFCAGDSTQLTAPAGFDSYLWAGGATTPSLTVTAPGTYGLTVTNGDGCTDSISVVVVEESLPVPDIIGPVAFCPDSTVELSLNGNYSSISWSDGSNGPTLQVSTATTVSVEVTNAAGCAGSDSVETSVFAAPVVGIQGEAAFCAGDTIALSADGGFAAYQWSTGSTDAVTEASEAGTYALTVTDANGCPASDAITIVENSLPEPQITGSSFYCAGQATTLEATPGFEAYEWGDGETSPALSVSEPGEYGLTVTDSNGCQGAASFEVDEIALPQPEIEGAAQFCPGDSTSLSANAIYAAYAWSTGDTTGSIIVGAPEDITLVVTNNQGCVDSTTLAAEWFDTEVPQVDGAPNFCPGTSTQLTAESGFAAYQWNTNTTAAELTVTEAGTYSVTVTDANGCQTANSIEIGEFTVAPPDITGPEGFCEDATATLQAEGGFSAYQWSTGAGTAALTVDTGGIFSLTVTDANGCVTDAAYQLAAYSLPQVAIGGSATFCPGGFATLNAGGAYASYLWSDGSTTPSIQVNEEGVYTLEVTDENGCTNSAALEVTEEAELSPVISGPLQFCPGTSTVLSAGAGYTVYDWENGPDAAEFTVTEPGTYSVYVEDASGCSGTAAVEVSLFPAPAVAIEGPAGFCAGASATLMATGSNIATYEWQDGSFQPQLEVEQAGSYSVIATDNNGCLDTATYAIATYPLPEVDIEAAPFFCAGESTTLSASGSFAAYEWNGQAGQASFQADAPGPYVLEVTDSNGCQSEASLFVEEIELPVADAGTPDTLTCEVEAVTLGGNATTTGQGFIYEWSGPGISTMNAGVAAPMVAQPGLYQLIVVDTVHNCTSVPDEAEVPLSNDVPIASLSVADTLDCLTTSLIIDGTASSDGPGLSYQWFDGQGNLLASGTDQLSASAPGTYVLQVKDVETGCQQQDTVSVAQDIELPEAEAGTPQRLDCAVTEVVLSAAGSSQGINFSLEWQNELSDTFASGDSVTVSAPGIYTLVVTNLSNNCQQADAVEITQDTEAPIANPGPAQQIDCLNPNATLDGSGSSMGDEFEQQWAFSQPGNVISQELSITVDTAGLYYLIVTNTDNQCESIATVEVDEVAAAPSALLTAASGPSCFGDENGTILIEGVEGGTSPYLYSFNGGSFDARQAYTGLSGGVYNIVVQDAIGCEHETSILLPEGNDLNVDLGGEINVNLGEQVQLFAQVNIPEEEVERLVWQSADSLSCTDCYDPWVQPSASGLYQVQVTDLNGCTASDQIQLFVDKRRRVFLPNAFSPNGDGANDVFFVQAGPEVVNIEAFEVYSRWGEPVFTVFDVPANEPDYGWNGQYRGELFNGGVFTWFARVEYVDGVVEIFKGDVLLMR